MSNKCSKPDCKNDARAGGRYCATHHALAQAIYRQRVRDKGDAVRVSMLALMRTLSSVAVACQATLVSINELHNILQGGEDEKEA